MDYSGMILDELRKMHFTLQRIAYTLVDIETLLEHMSSVRLTKREADAPKQDVTCEHNWLASTNPGVIAICTNCGMKQVTS